MAIRTGVAADAPGPESQGQVKRSIAQWADGMEVSGFLFETRTIATQFGEGHLLEIEHEDGKRQTFNCPTALCSLIGGVGRGVPVTIRCLGKGPTKSGQTAWQFKVFAEGVVADTGGDVMDQDSLPF